MSDHPDNEHAYQRAARLLGRKLGLDWRTLPREQVEEYLRKIEIAGQRDDRRETQFYELIRRFVIRQHLPFQALKELRPQILIATGAISNKDLQYAPKSRFDIPQSGFWGKNDEWKYFIHGLGCQLIHIETQEPIEWNAPRLNSFDAHWFINWLKWYLEHEPSDRRPEFPQFTNADDLESFVLSMLSELEKQQVITHTNLQYPLEYTLSERSII